MNLDCAVALANLRAGGPGSGRRPDGDASPQNYADKGRQISESASTSTEHETAAAWHYAQAKQAEAKGNPDLAAQHTFAGDNHRQAAQDIREGHGAGRETAATSGPNSISRRVNSGEKIW